MKVYLNKITGIDDAITTMYFSKRSWTREKETDIRESVYYCTDNFSGRFLNEYSIPPEILNEFKNYMDKLCKWGTKHVTMLRFVDLSITVDGLHRGGQDDLDSHAKRMDNRIIRASTRLGDFSSGEMSDYYKDKIIPTDVACEQLNIELPEVINVNGETFLKAVNGYIREDLKDKRDVKRGLYMESIPSSFIFKINLTEWAHVYRERNMNGTAHPELKECVEEIQRQLEDMMPWFNKELVMKIQTD